MTDRIAFQEWFSNSKVVDRSGRPLVVYHGTNQAIRSFSSERLGANTGSISSKAFFFTDNPIEAGEYAAMSARKQVSNALEREANAERLLKALEQANRRGDYELVEQLTLEFEESEWEAMSGTEMGANILPVLLQIRKPLFIDMNGGADLERIAAAIEIAKDNGSDGLRLDNVYDPVAERPGNFNTTQWVVFHSEQISSIFEWNMNFMKQPELRQSFHIECAP